jgi:hypothetical protein
LPIVESTDVVTAMQLFGAGCEVVHMMTTISITVTIEFRVVNVVVVESDFRTEDIEVEDEVIRGKQELAAGCVW